MRKATCQIGQVKRENWEQGSDFHWMTYQKEVLKLLPWAKKCICGGSGRDLFRLLLKHGMQTYDWRRLWIPAYFCNDVTRAILKTGIDVVVYPYGPEDTDSPLTKIDFLLHDVLLVVNFFGISKRNKYVSDQRKVVTIIEDHTHDPWSNWSYTSNADWCIASLRKVLPLPDGGVLWSPLHHQLPAAVPITNKRRDASLKKIAGMSLKALFIDGHCIEKNIFRKLLTSGEENIATGNISGMSDWARNMLPAFPIDRWREKRRMNHRCLCNEISDLPWLSVLGKEDNDDSYPFSAVIIFDTAARRNFVCEKLIQSQIYPAILWPLEKPLIGGIPDKYLNLSRRILSIHCDMRYDESDMIYVGAQIRKYGNDEYIDVK